MAHPSWNYTTFLNILALAGALVYRFFRTGGREVLAVMGGRSDDTGRHDHGDHPGTGDPSGGTA